MMKWIPLFVLFVLLSGFSFAQAPDFQALAKIQAGFLEVIRSCRQSAFDPPDPEGRISLINVTGLSDAKCRLIIQMDSGRVEMFLPKEIYTTAKSYEDAFRGECYGDCASLKVAIAPPVQANEDAVCMDNCVMYGCDKGILLCMVANKANCEKTCGLIKGPDVSTMGPLERCIYECVGPGVMCSPVGGAGGEQNPQCKQCADDCVGVHGSGNNCLTEPQLEEKKAACKTCEHCDAAPVYGLSGSGYDCIIDATCFDASSEWGDEPGTGPASYEPGHAPTPDQKYWWEAEVNAGEGALVMKAGEKTTEIELRVSDAVEIENDTITLKAGDGEVAVEERSEEVINHYADAVDAVTRLTVDVEEERVVYTLETKEKAKLFGFFPVEMGVRKKIDAQNLTLVKEEKPWWDFLTSGYASEASCVDTDNGLTYGKSGYLYNKVTNKETTTEQTIVVPEDHPYQDVCLDAKNLTEFYCEDNKEHSVAYKCEEVCHDSGCTTLDVSDVKVEDVGFYYVKISWKTNVPATGKVVYEKLPKTEDTIEMKSAADSTDHSLVLYAGILPETDYNFKVVSCYKGAFCKESKVMQFKTLPKGCTIGGKFYIDGYANENGCQFCNASGYLDAWSNCYFQGTVHLTDATPWQVDGAYKYSGCNVEGKVPNIAVSVIKDKWLKYGCYLENQHTEYVEFLTSMELPPDLAWKHGGVGVAFTCHRGELSLSSGSALPIPLPPKCMMGQNCTEEAPEEGPYEVCE